ncbi:MAG: hypothetical protein JWQ62_857 [Lacunisphaera sp.]|nr:hypothetical protein [Lacunisphaera sp.]
MNSPMSTATTELPALRIAFGAGGIFDAGVPVLAGEAVEELFGAARPAGRMGDVALFQSGDWLIGAATVPGGDGLEEATRRLYRDIFTATNGRHLARIWNYVPAINETGAGGLENYRVFCRGRSLAFEQHYGTGFNARLPSASAVGTKAAALTVAFAACAIAPRHVENPLQVPAYAYPGEYGPRPPSFARATVVPGREQAAVFISGTAAIRGHATLPTRDTGEQLECTLGNLREISRACGIGPDLDAGGASTRNFKVYLRHAEDRAMVAATLDGRLLTGTDRVSYLQANICRATLLVEIEVSLFGVRRAS